MRFGVSHPIQHREHPRHIEYQVRRVMDRWVVLEIYRSWFGRLKQQVVPRIESHIGHFHSKVEALTWIQQQKQTKVDVDREKQFYKAIFSLELAHHTDIELEHKQLSRSHLKRIDRED